jgi:prefoldin subunit 5
MDPETEKQFLQNQARALQTELESIGKRLAEIKPSGDDQ